MKNFLEYLFSENKTSLNESKHLVEDVTLANIVDIFKNNIALLNKIQIRLFEITDDMSLVCYYVKNEFKFSAQDEVFSTVAAIEYSTDKNISNGKNITVGDYFKDAKAITENTTKTLDLIKIKAYSTSDPGKLNDVVLFFDSQLDILFIFLKNKNATKQNIDNIINNITTQQDIWQKYIISTSPTYVKANDATDVDPVVEDPIEKLDEKPIENVTVSILNMSNLSLISYNDISNKIIIASPKSYDDFIKYTENMSEKAFFLSEDDKKKKIAYIQCSLDGGQAKYAQWIKIDVTKSVVTLSTKDLKTLYPYVQVAKGQPTLNDYNKLLLKKKDSMYSLIYSIFKNAYNKSSDGITIVYDPNNYFKKYKGITADVPFKIGLNVPASLNQLLQTLNTSTEKTSASDTTDNVVLATANVQVDGKTNNIPKVKNSEIDNFNESIKLKFDSNGFNFVNAKLWLAGKKRKLPIPLDNNTYFNIAFPGVDDTLFLTGDDLVQMLSTFGIYDKVKSLYDSEVKNKYPNAKLSMTFNYNFK